MPFNIDPQTIQKMLFGGPQAAMMPQDPIAPAPQAPPAAPPAPAPLADAQPPSSTPPRGSVAEAMPQQQQTPTAAAPPSTPPQNAPIPQAPQPYHHGTLAKIMLGIGEALGNPLATRIGERDRGRQQEVDEYTRNLPTAQYQANITQQKNTADLEHTRAQTHLEQVQAEIAQQNLPLQEQAQKHYEALLKAWQERATPDFDSYAHSYLAGLPDAIRRRLEPHLEEIKQTPQTGKGYKLNMQDDMPVSVESYGKTYQPDDKGGFGPEVSPQAQQEFAAAQKTHKTKRGEKLEDEKTVAGFAADRAAQAFSNQQQAKAQGDLGKVYEGVRGANDAYVEAKKMYDRAEKAKTGSEASSADQALAMAHLRAVMSITQHYRVTNAEIEQQYKQGSLPEQWKRMFESATAGPKFTHEQRSAMLGTVRDVAATNFESFSRERGNYDVGANPKVKYPNSFEEAVGEKAGQGGQGKVPAGATHTGIGSQDKKKHWLDAQGNDLGLAE